jgi:SAM-dependent methyltransferase
MFKWIASKAREWRAASSDYYQKKHDTSSGYKNNNWLVSEIDSLLSVNPASIVEIGCGNGRFLADVKQRGIPSITGLDWAHSPMLASLGVKDLVHLCDITKDDIPSADLVCSADVLEHISPTRLPATLARILRAGRYQYHVIACYDDGHSHLSIMPPEQWLTQFRQISTEYRLLDVRTRPGKRHPETVCIISNFNPRDYYGVALASLRLSARGQLTTERTSVLPR